MKTSLLLLFCIGNIFTVLSQSPESLYKKADSLYRIKDYQNAAMAYNEGIRLQGANAGLRYYRSAAGSWAKANMADSAFNELNLVAKSSKLTKFDVYQVENGLDFVSLQPDKKWNQVLENLRRQAEKTDYVEEEYIYGRKDGMALTLILTKPKVKANGKAIIYVISGSWISSYDGIEMPTNDGEQFLARGYTVFAVVHGSQPRYAIPDAVSDIKRAVRYIRYNANKFGIDPDHIGITGTSAGGHLSLTVATADDKPNLASPDPVDRVSSRVQAVAVLFPPTDLLNWGGPGFNLVNAKEQLKMVRTWGAANFTRMNDKVRLYEEVTDTAERNKIGREVSPYYYVSADDPPVFIIHGDADPTVPLQQSQAIIAKFNEAGVPNRYIIKKGGKHIQEDMLPEWLEFVDWFDKYLK